MWRKSDTTILFARNKESKGVYGVVTGKDLSESVIKIVKAIEKPTEFVSNITIMPVYIFTKSIFESLGNIKLGKGGELQLTDAIELLVTEGKRVFGVKLTDTDVRLDIGSPATFMEALSLSASFINGN